jgi:hypothetical protein
MLAERQSAAVGEVSDRSIYRFLAESGLTKKARREKSLISQSLTFIDKLLYLIA